MQRNVFNYSSKLSNKLEAYSYLQKTNTEIINYLKDTSFQKYKPLMEVLVQSQAYMTENYVQFMIDDYRDILTNAQSDPENYFYLDTVNSSKRSAKDVEKVVNQINEDKKNISLFIDSAISLYGKAINTCDDCAYYNYVARMDFVDYTNDIILYNKEANEDNKNNEKFANPLTEKQKSFYYNDWETLKTMGAKPRYAAVTLTPEYHYGKFSGYGGEISFKDVFEPLQIIRYKGKRTNIVLQEFAAFGTIGFEYYSENDQKVYKISAADFGVSIFRGNFLQFFYTTLPGQKAIGYRPELGLGFGPLTVTYGMNVHFKKHFENFNRHLLNVKLNIPLYKIKWKYKLDD